MRAWPSCDCRRQEFPQFLQRELGRAALRCQSLGGAAAKLAALVFVGQQIRGMRNSGRRADDADRVAAAK